MKRKKVNPKIIFGQNLKRLRLAKGISQDELAQQLDTTNVSISNYELGKSLPHKPMRLKIGNLFGEDESKLRSVAIDTEHNKENEHLIELTSPTDPKGKLLRIVYQAIVDDVVSPVEIFSALINATSDKRLREAEALFTFHGTLNEYQGPS